MKESSMTRMTQNLRNVGYLEIDSYRLFLLSEAFLHFYSWARRRNAVPNIK